MDLAAMLWAVDKFKTRIRIAELHHDLEVPIQIEIEYQLEGNRVFLPSLTKKIRFNRPLLLKEARSFSQDEIDSLIQRSVDGAIQRHFRARGYVVDDSQGCGSGGGAEAERPPIDPPHPRKREA